MTTTSQLQRDLKTRSKTLNRTANCIVGLIAILIITACFGIYFADRITSNELVNVNRALAQVTQKEGELAEKLVPNLVKLNRNADLIQGAIQEYANLIADGPAFRSHRDSEKRKFTYYGFAKTTDLLSTSAFKTFLGKIKDMQMPPSTNASDKSIIVVEYLVALDGDEKNDQLSARYLWAFKKDSIPSMLTAIDGAGPAESITTEEGADIDKNLDLQLSYKAEFSSLEKLRKDAVAANKDNEKKLEEDELNAGKNKGPAASNEPNNPFGLTNGGLYILQLNVNKFGIISLLGVLIGMLSALYKYNMRLSAFYLGRSQALQLAGSVEPSIFVTLATALTPTIDFAKRENSLTGRESKDEDKGKDEANGEDEEKPKDEKKEKGEAA